MLCRCWLGGRKGIQPVKTEWWGAGVFVWSEVQTCIWPSWCHCHSLSLDSVKSTLVLPFWYWLTLVVPVKGPLNVCVCFSVHYSFPCLLLMLVAIFSGPRPNLVCGIIIPSGWSWGGFAESPQSAMNAIGTSTERAWADVDRTYDATKHGGWLVLNC